MATVFNMLDKVTMRYDRETLATDVTPSKLSEEGDSVIYPDSMFVNYALIAKSSEGIGRFSEDNVEIAIVGAGVSGLTCTLELIKLAAKTDSAVHVTLYECDPEHFLNMPAQIQDEQSELQTFKAGRVMSVTNRLKGVVYEIGAMRIPATAALVWFYTSMFSPDNRLSLFPNPNVVSTQFAFNDHYVYFRGNNWNTDDAMSRLVKDYISMMMKRMFGCAAERVISLFCIGDLSPETTKDMLIRGNPSNESRAYLQSSWLKFVNLHDGVSLRNALVTTIEDLMPDLIDPPYDEVADYKNDNVLMIVAPPEPHLNNFETLNKLHFYLRIIGAFGFGTGGFGPLFDMSFVDFMRLYLWGYNHEYLLPFEKNSELLSNIYTRALQLKNKDSSLSFANKEVVRVVSVTSDNKRLSHKNKSVCSIYVKGEDDPCMYDYVVLALPPVITGPLLSDLSSNVDDVDCKYFYRLLSNSVDQLQMVPSSKTFGTVNVTEMERVPSWDSERVRAVLSSDGLGSSYFLNTIKGYTAFLLSYAWSHDASKLQYKTKSYPKSFDAEAFLEILTNRNRLWMSGIADPMDFKYNYNWTATSGAGGFKLDKPNQEFYSGICARSFKSARIDNVNVFIAGDSYSHRGGWIEGALISAINAIAGVLVASARNTVAVIGRRDPLDCLSVEARKLFHAPHP